MAIQDFTKLLGKKVGYVSPSCGSDPAVYFTGYILGVMKYMEGAEIYDEIMGRGDILFLQDGASAPDFIGSANNFHIIE